VGSFRHSLAKLKGSFFMVAKKVDCPEFIHRANDNLSVFFNDETVQDWPTETQANYLLAGTKMMIYTTLSAIKEHADDQSFLDCVAQIQTCIEKLI
jgi:hypothetical protein